ncbi:transposase [Mycobacterium sp. KBS0706]|nr:transposase [Mycobacterium sp. KBS0706]
MLPSDGHAARLRRPGRRRRCGVEAGPYSGHLFLFRSRKADYLKILHYDGTGLCLFANRVASYCISCRLM